jgi:hypothetical protein
MTKLIGTEDFAVLVGRESSGVDVDVGVDFDGRHSYAVRLQVGSTIRRISETLVIYSSLRCPTDNQFLAGWYCMDCERALAMTLYIYHPADPGSHL